MRRLHRNVILLIGIALWATAALQAQMLIPTTTSAIPSDSISSRLQFTEQIGNYFSSELDSYPSPSPSFFAKESEKRERVTVEAFFQEDMSWKVIFRFPSEVSVKEELDDNSLLLTFNQSVDSQDIIAVQEKLGYLIKRISTGFNTLYFYSKRPVEYQVFVCGNELSCLYHFKVESLRNHQKI